MKPNEERGGYHRRMPNGHGNELHDEHHDAGIKHVHSFTLKIHFLAPLNQFVDFNDEDNHRYQNHSDGQNVTKKAIYISRCKSRKHEKISL